MNQTLFELLTKLNGELRNHQLIMDVKNAEEQMENNEDFMRAVVKLQNITAEYNDAVKYNVETEDLQKKLFEAKYNLDTLDVVKNYRNKYKIAQNYLNQISKTIFANISPKLKVNELI